LTCYAQSEVSCASQIYFDRDRRKAFVHEWAVEYFLPANRDGNEDISPAQTRVVSNVIAVYAYRCAEVPSRGWQMYFDRSDRGAMQSSHKWLPSYLQSVALARVFFERARLQLG
jgi:hypothetical protein